jgi:hypothetical protein
MNGKVALHNEETNKSTIENVAFEVYCIQHDNRWLYCLHPTPLDSIAIEADYSVHILRHAIFIVPRTEEACTNLKLNIFT